MQSKSAISHGILCRYFFLTQINDIIRGSCGPGQLHPVRSQRLRLRVRPRLERALPFTDVDLSTLSGGRCIAVQDRLQCTQHTHIAIIDNSPLCAPICCEARSLMASHTAAVGAVSFPFGVLVSVRSVRVGHAQPAAMGPALRDVVGQCVGHVCSLTSGTQTYPTCMEGVCRPEQCHIPI